MVAKFLQLAKNYRFGLKLIELLLASMCLGILIRDETNLIPRWLWLIYCTNSLTYIVVYVALLASYIYEENCDYLDLVFSVIGAMIYGVGGLASIVRSAIYIPADASNDSYELLLGINCIVCAVLMVGHVSWKIYTNNRMVSVHH